MINPKFIACPTETLQDVITGFEVCLFYCWVAEIIEYGVLGGARYFEDTVDDPSLDGEMILP